MIDFVLSFFDLPTVVTFLFALSAFAAVLSFVSPMLESDALKSRMKEVSLERNKLRDRQRAQLGSNQSRLREVQGTGVTNRVVETLNLRRVFEPEASREMLRQAGLRSERHLVLYLAARFASPILLGLVAFIYSSTIFVDILTPPMRIVVAVVAVLIGNYLPVVLVKNMIIRRQDSIRRAWPDALDLMLICVESGMAIEPAMQRVAREIGPISVPLAEEMTLTVAELAYLQERRKAFENLAKRTGLPTVKAVTTSFIQAERYGTPLGTALRVLAQENRDARMSEAERKAAALPPKLTVPMMLFFLPVIFVVILGPSVFQVMKMMGD
ncbi:type II secretion system F family protein [Aestuariivirga sp.]|jgi:tight adherence protein C|uniref:type II secretion system F family protein n=1 Tax=Aestuariivirga sp. TaxID=2650926 RepID=UPI0037843861